MKSLIIAGTVIASKESAKNLVKRLNAHFLSDTSREMAYVIDDHVQSLVTAGFLTWEEVEELEIEAFAQS